MNHNLTVIPLFSRKRSQPTASSIGGPHEQIEESATRFPEYLFTSLRRSARVGSDAATNTWDELDGAAIELVGGYFERFDESHSGYRDVWNGYEALRYLHDEGVLDAAIEWFALPEMRRHDVAFGLALHENEAANFLFSDSVAAYGWKQVEARDLGLRAAISATQCYMWGVSLKEEWLRRIIRANG